MEKLEGTISINRVICNDREDYVQVQLKDKYSGIIFVIAEVGIREFADALFGRGCIPTKYKLCGIEKVGTRLETKTLQVEVVKISSCIDGLTAEDRGQTAEDLIDQAICPYEIDGWQGRRRDCKNFHNLVSSSGTKDMYNVSFYRWVKK